MTGELSALVSAFTWALVSVLLRKLQYRTSALPLNALRCVVAAVLAALAAIATGRLHEFETISTPALLYLSASVLVGMGLGDTLYFFSLKLLGVARAIPLSNAYPIFAAVMAAAFLGEPVTGRLVAGTILVVAGVILVMIPGRVLLEPPRPEQARDERLGVILVLMASVSWASATSLVKIGAQEVDGLTATALRLVVASAALLLAAAFGRPGFQFREYRGAQLAGVVGAGAGSAISAVTFLLAVQLIGAAKTATLTSTAPLFAVPLSVLTGERLTWQIVLGSLISVVGIWTVVSA